MNELQSKYTVVLIQAITDPIYALVSLAVVLITGCTTVSDKVTFGTFEYTHREVSVSGEDSVAMASTLTSPSLWNIPVVKTTCETVLNWIFGGQSK
jgi:hypothetical protein